MWHSGTWFVGQGGVALMAGLDDLGGLAVEDTSGAQR